MTCGYMLRSYFLDIVVKGNKEAINEEISEAENYIANAWEYHWVKRSNENPNQEINDRVEMKLLDYLWSPKGREDKKAHGLTVLNNRLRQLKALHSADVPCEETEEEARIQARSSMIPFNFSCFGNRKCKSKLHKLLLRDRAESMNR